MISVNSETISENQPIKAGLSPACAGEENREQGPGGRKTNRWSFRLLAGALALFSASTSATAVSSYTELIPNGQVHRCATCHERAGTHDLNSFGMAFYSANSTWSAQLAAQDCDSDGSSNGAELGEPKGTWKKGEAVRSQWTSISIPGDASSKPARLRRFSVLMAPLASLFGRFHPLVVHLPIGGLLLAACLEIFVLFGWKAAAQNRNLILGLTSVGVVGSVLCGWVLSRTGNYEPGLLRLHQWTGIAMVGACFVTWLLVQRQLAYRLALGVSFLLVCWAGHYGGGLTHGRDFLELNFPTSIRAAAEPENDSGALVSTGAEKSPVEPASVSTQ
jgi:hypothetical protein